jgi:alpha-glucosidase
VVDGYKKADIPLEAIHLDIDYMEGYRIFTVNKDRFPAFAALSPPQKARRQSGHDRRPGHQSGSDYSIYQEAIKNGYVATSMANLRQCGLAGRQRLSRLQRAESPVVVER